MRNIISGRALILQLSFYFRCMWKYTTPFHGLPIGAFFRGKSARDAYRKNDDYSITKGNSTVVLGSANPQCFISSIHYLWPVSYTYAGNVEFP
jgi:hypothetical protein